MGLIIGHISHIRPISPISSIGTVSSPTMRQHHQKSDSEYRQRVSAFFEGPAGDTHPIGGIQAPPDFVALNCTVRKSDRGKVPRFVMHRLGVRREIRSGCRAPHAVPIKRGHDFGGTLRNCIIQRISAANVCLQWMLAAHPIAKLHQVSIARPTTVRFVRSRRKDGTENAVLHMEHRHVLVNRRLPGQPGSNFDETSCSATGLDSNRMRRLRAGLLARPGIGPSAHSWRSTSNLRQRESGDRNKTAFPPSCGPAFHRRHT